MEQQDSDIKQLLKIVEDQHVQLDRQHNQIMELEDKVQEPPCSSSISPDTQGVQDPALGAAPLVQFGVERKVGTMLGHQF